MKNKDIFMSDDLLYETCIYNVICSKYSENTIEQMMKLQIKHSRLEFLYEMYLSYFAKGFIDISHFSSNFNHQNHLHPRNAQRNEQDNIRNFRLICKEETISRFSVTTRRSMNQIGSRYQSISSKALSTKNHPSLAISTENEFETKKCPIKMLKSNEVPLSFLKFNPI